MEMDKLNELTKRIIGCAMLKFAKETWLINEF